MVVKHEFKSNILDFRFESFSEISRQLGLRLKQQRLTQRLKQLELSKMAGVSVGTVKNLETKGQSSLESLVRIVMALNLSNELETLFALKIQSIAQMEAIEKIQLGAALPKRIR